jgi:hypothetical protein
MAEQIIFPDREPYWEFDRDCLSFPAFVDGKRVKCLVTAELLMARFGARIPSQEECKRAYEKHKAEIQDIARSLILAGQVMPNNEVLLTTRVFRLKLVSFGDQLQRDKELFSKAQKATASLEEVVGSSAGMTKAEWDRGEDEGGRPLLILRLSDWTGWVSAVFHPRELDSADQMRFRFHRLWGNLLQIRSSRQLQELQEGEAPEET